MSQLGPLTLFRQGVTVTNKPSPPMEAIMTTRQRRLLIIPVLALLLLACHASVAQAAPRDSGAWVNRLAPLSARDLPTANRPPSSIIDSRTIRSGAMRIEIVDALDTQRTTQIGMFGFRGQGVDFYARDTSHGTQLLAVHLSRSKLTTMYRFPGMRLKERGDTLAVTDPSGVVHAHVEAPFAVDAVGKPVPTTFRIDGEFLHQEIAPSAATIFPVVSEPDVRWGWPVTQVLFSRDETIGIAAGVGTCATITGRAPSPLGRTISISCGLLAVYAGTLLAQNRCIGVQVDLLLPPGLGTRPFGYRC